MAQTIKIKRSSTSVAPTSLAEGELAYTHVPLTAQQIADGVEDTAGKLLIGRPGSTPQGGVALMDPIGGKYFTDRAEAAYGWGDHGAEGYLTQTAGDNRYPLTSTVVNTIYQKEMNTASAGYVSFEFTGYVNTIGRDFYIFDVIGYKDFTDAESFVHYTVYLNCTGIFGGTLADNTITADVVAHNQSVDANLTFKLERNLSPDNTHKLWIGIDEGYSGIQILHYPTYIGKLTRVAASSFAFTSTEPTTTTVFQPTVALSTSEAYSTFAPIVDTTLAVYKSPVNTSTNDAWTSFEFTGYDSTEGYDFYLFDVYAHEKPDQAGGFAHYSVYLNCKNSIGIPLTANVIDIEIVGHNVINTDLEFYIERDLAGNKHKLWIKRDTAYSHATIVKSPVSAGNFNTIESTAFTTVTTDPVVGATPLGVRKALLLETDGDIGVSGNITTTSGNISTSNGTVTASGNISTSGGNIVSGSSKYVKSGSAGFYVGNNQIVETSGANINVKGVNDITLEGALKGPADFIIDPAGYGDNTGKVTIAGDLTVTGTTTIIDSNTVSIGDRVVRLAQEIGDVLPPTNLVSGLEINRGNQSYDAYFLWREANDTGKKWVISEGGPVDFTILHSNNWDHAYTGAVDGGTF